MIVCGVCKEKKEIMNTWSIHEHAVDHSLLRNIKVCDNCASSVIRKITNEINPDEAKGNIDLGRSGLINSLFLNTDGNLEITISMDLAKARKIILDTSSKK